MKKIIEHYSEALKILNTPGTSAIVRVSGLEITFPIAKKDLIAVIRREQEINDSAFPSDYNGDVGCFYWDENSQTLLVDGAI